MIRHLLLTGHSGVGKTTVMTQLAHALTDYHPDGFFTREIRENGIGKGFELVTFDDGHQLLSHIILPGHFRVGRYVVDLAGFEKLLAIIDLRHSPSRVVNLDENRENGMPESAIYSRSGRLAEFLKNGNCHCGVKGWRLSGQCPKVSGLSGGECHPPESFNPCRHPCARD